MHVGICKLAMGPRPIIATIPDIADKLAPASETPSPKIEAAKAKFDKNAYQREYMRKKRQAIIEKKRK